MDFIFQEAYLTGLRDDLGILGWPGRHSQQITIPVVGDPYCITKQEGVHISLLLLYPTLPSWKAVSQIGKPYAMANTSDHELAAVNVGAGIDDTSVVDSQGLPPVDRGKHAWLTLTACFFLEATVWGYEVVPRQIFVVPPWMLILYPGSYIPTVSCRTTTSSTSHS